MIEFELEKLFNLAKKENNIKKRLLATKNSTEPLKEFCNIAQDLGFEIYLGELIAYGETQNDAKLRSVNGGGVNKIDGWDDTYEQFILSLEWC